MKKWEKFSQEEIEQFVEESFSYAELARKIGYDDTSKNGSVYRTVHQMIDELNLDTSHFTGQGWNKDNFDYSRFRYGKAIKNGTTLAAIVNLRGHRCEMCGLSEWMGKKITLEVHHVDGDSLNNELDNLQLLCPNCHSTTNNWKGRGIKKKGVDLIDEETFKDALVGSDNIRQALIKLNISPKGGNYNRAKEIIEKYNISFPQIKSTCCDCGKTIKNGATRCKSCDSELRRTDSMNNKPVTRDELKQLIRATPFLQIGKQFNVSDNAIRKWCKLFNLPSTSLDIKAYSDEEWESI